MMLVRRISSARDRRPKYLEPVEEGRLSSVVLEGQDDQRAFTTSAGSVKPRTKPRINIRISFFAHTSLDSDDK
jgi:hypothetical protein